MLAACVVRRRADGRLASVVHVHSIQVPTAADWVVMDAFAFDETQRQEEKSYLAKLSKRLAEFDVHLNAELLEGDVVDALRNSVRVNKVDLVVMSTHGRGPYSRFWLGSVADSLVRKHYRSNLALAAEGRGPLKLTRDVCVEAVARAARRT